MSKWIAEFELEDGDTMPEHMDLEYKGVKIDFHCREALEQDSREDEYISVPKKALKYRTAGMVAYNAEWLKNHFEIERAVICGLQEPCGDCISRSEALKIFKYNYKGERIPDYDCDNFPVQIAIKTVKEMLRGLPPVTPKQKTGHNCNEDYADCDQFVCSECGIELQDWHRIERDEDDGEITCHEYVMKYCPNCGAKMEEV